MLRSVTLPAFLSVVHLLLLLEAVKRLGPARTLLATTAAPHITNLVRRKRTKTTAIIVIAAIMTLGLVFHDTIGGGARVRERVLKSRAGHAVTTKLQRISQSMGQTVRSNEQLNKLRARYGKPPNELEQGQIPLRHSGPSGDTKNRNEVISRRRLLAVPTKAKQKPAPRDANVDNSYSENPNVVGDKKSSSARTASQEHAQEVNEKETVFTDVKRNSEEHGRARNITKTLKNKMVTDGDAIVDTGASPGQSLRVFFGVLFVVFSSLASSIGNSSRQNLAHDAGDDYAVSCVTFFMSAFMIFPFVLFYWITGRGTDGVYTRMLFSQVVPSGALLGFCLLAYPDLSYTHFGTQGGTRRSQPHQRTPSKGNTSMNSFGSGLFPLSEMGAFTRAAIYPYMCLSIVLLRILSTTVFGFQEPLSFSSVLAAFMLCCISVLDSGQSRSDNRQEPSFRERSRSFNSGDISSVVGRGTARQLRYIWKILSSSALVSVHSMRDIIRHARLNKASWQVLNFLVLQSGMATVKLIYATMTHASGLISISADNFFCCISLAIGLQAIRVTSRKPTYAYTYGFSRFESVCGFANGVMLIYVAVLIVLEAFERLKDTNNVAAGHTFTVCLFGMTGNILGLYFFPPESRRENHNVQGIYLHIWANTLAFASMAVSTAIAAAVPAWEMIDMVSATLVGIGIVVLAIPLLLRSGRLLLLLVPREKQKSLRILRDRLDNIDGVIKISGLRVWNLSPNSLVASVRIKAANYYDGPDIDILYKARSVFASIGVPASQCTIQISRIEAENKAVVFFHKRSQSGFGDTGIDLEALQMCTELAA